MKTDNELIAEFMGAELVQTINQGGSEFRCYAYREKTRTYTLYDLQSTCGLFHTALRFDKSWDWIMPVVEKIEQMHLMVESASKSVIIYYNGAEDEDMPWLKSFPEQGINSFGDSKIKAVYAAVVEFINWYNENK